ncbi:RlpA-like domain superfamily [Sesbania bispinosa]|nr:RlpA-like domain superfamily [Sesbania bispinosa]
MMMIQVRCKIPQLCDSNGAIVVTTGNGEGYKTDFIMSPRGFSRLGHNPNASAELIKYGTVDVEYKRVSCTFNGYNIKFQIQESSSNPGYFSIVVLYVGGTYDINAIEMWQRENQWQPLHRNYGAVFDYSNPPRGDIHLRFKLSGFKSAWFSVPSNWKAGDTYSTSILPN